MKLTRVLRSIRSSIQFSRLGTIQIVEGEPRWLTYFKRLVKQKGELHEKSMAPILQRLSEVFSFNPDPEVMPSPFLSQVDEILRINVIIKDIRDYIDKIHDLLQSPIRKFAFYVDYSMIFALVTSEDMLVPLRDRALSLLRERRSQLYTIYMSKSSEFNTLHAALRARFDYEFGVGSPGSTFPALAPKSSAGRRALEQKTPPDVGDWLKEVVAESHRLSEKELLDFVDYKRPDCDQMGCGRKLSVFEKLRSPKFRD